MVFGVTWLLSYLQACERLSGDVHVKLHVFQAYDDIVVGSIVRDSFERNQHLTYSTTHVSPLLSNFSKLPGPVFEMAASICSTIMSS